MNPKLFGTPRGDRRCRNCAACCTTHTVAEIGKAEGERCQHLTTGWKPCGIYAGRPKSCQEFQCLWLFGLLSDDDRPDKLGAVFDYEDHPKYSHTFKIFEVIADASDHPRVRVHIERFRKSGIVLVFRKNGGRRVLGGPESAMKLFMQDAQLQVAR